MSLPRALHPATNAPGLTATAGAVYAAATMLYNAHYHHGVLSTPVLVSGAAAIIALLTRFVVTPTADPVDGAGRSLVPAPTGRDDLARWQAAMEAYENSAPVPPNALRAEAGLPPLPPDARVAVVPPQPIGASQVILVEPTAEDPPEPAEEPRP